TTTYAENIGVMAATRVYSTLAYYIAATVAILFGFCPKFGAVVAATPGGVLGGITLLAGAQVSAEDDGPFGRRLAGRAPQLQDQRAAAVPEPQLIGAHDVPARSLARLQQEIDGGRGAALPAITLGPQRHRRPPGLAIPAPFGMGRQVQLLGQGRPRCHQLPPTAA